MKISKIVSNLILGVSLIGVNVLMASDLVVSSDDEAMSVFIDNKSIINEDYNVFDITDLLTNSDRYSIKCFSKNTQCLDSNNKLSRGNEVYLIAQDKYNKKIMSCYHKANDNKVCSSQLTEKYSLKEVDITNSPIPKKGYVGDTFNWQITTNTKVKDVVISFLDNDNKISLTKNFKTSDNINWEYSKCLKGIGDNRKFEIFVDGEKVGESTFDVIINPNIDNDFELNECQEGLKLYKHKYYNDYVQVVNLKDGGKIKFLLEDSGEFWKEEKKIKLFNREKYIDGIWSNLKDDLQNQAFCISNGQFFDSTQEKNPVTISFDIKIDGVFYKGSVYEEIKNTYKGEKILKIYDKFADIQNYDYQFGIYEDKIDSYNAIVGVDIKKYKYHSLNIVGLSDKDSDGKYEEVINYYTITYRKSDIAIENAKKVLKKFGVAVEQNKIMALDGGGSTTLYCKKKYNVGVQKNYNAPIPQTILTYSSK